MPQTTAVSKSQAMLFAVGIFCLAANPMPGHAETKGAAMTCYKVTDSEMGGWTDPYLKDMFGLSEIRLGDPAFMCDVALVDGADNDMALSRMVCYTIAEKRSEKSGPERVDALDAFRETYMHVGELELFCAPAKVYR